MNSCARRLLAAAVAVLTLSGCTADAADPPSRATGTPGDGGALDGIADEQLVPQLGTRTTLLGLELDADGNPMVLAATSDEGQGPLALVRRDGDGEWEELILEEQDRLSFSAQLGLGDDGTAVVTGYSGDEYSITRVTADGEVTTVPVAAPLDPSVRTLVTALAPAGDLLFVAYTTATTAHLLTVDAVTGAVLAEQDVTPDSGRVQPAALSPTSDGSGVVVAFDHFPVDGEPSDRTTLHRYDSDLRLLEEVSLGDDGELADTLYLSVGTSGTAYVALRVGDPEAPNPDDGTRLLTVPAGGPAAEVAFFPGVDLFDGLVVDPAEEWAYLASLPDSDGTAEYTVTAVELATGEVGEPLWLCDGYRPDLAMAVDAGQLVVGAHCPEEDPAVVWSLR